MASFRFKFSFCLVLLFKISFQISVARPVPVAPTLSSIKYEGVASFPSPIARSKLIPKPPTLSPIDDKDFDAFPSFVANPPPVPSHVSHALSTNNKHDMIQQAREMFKGRLQREDVIRSYYVSDRVSPGGPDPHHH
ncbi:unnamed protein product [Amaranthus hypochondriacus]